MKNHREEQNSFFFFLPTIVKFIPIHRINIIFGIRRFLNNLTVFIQFICKTIHIEI